MAPPDLTFRPVVFNRRYEGSQAPLAPFLKGVWWDSPLFRSMLSLRLSSGFCSHFNVNRVCSILPISSYAGTKRQWRHFSASSLTSTEELGVPVRSDVTPDADTHPSCRESFSFGRYRPAMASKVFTAKAFRNRKGDGLTGRPRRSPESDHLYSNRLDYSKLIVSCGMATGATVLIRAAGA